MGPRVVPSFHGDLLVSKHDRLGDLTSHESSLLIQGFRNICI